MLLHGCKSWLFKVLPTHETPFKNLKVYSKALVREDVKVINFWFSRPIPFLSVCHLGWPINTWRKFCMEKGIARVLLQQTLGNNNKTTTTTTTNNNNNNNKNNSNSNNNNNNSNSDNKNNLGVIKYLILIWTPHH